MVSIRLMRIGKRNRPHYRVVAQSTRQKADGAYLELLGAYDPLKKTLTNVKLERINMWKARGAAISPSVRSLLKRIKTAQE